MSQDHYNISVVAHDHNNTNDIKLEYLFIIQ